MEKTNNYLQSHATPEDFLSAAVFFSTISIFPFQVNNFFIFKVLSTTFIFLAAAATAKGSAISTKGTTIAITCAISLTFSGITAQWQNFLNFELWLIKPLVFICAIILLHPYIIKFDFTNPRYQKYLAISISLLMSTIFTQAIYFLATNRMFDFQEIAGLGQTRSHHQIYSIELYRLSGAAAEPAIYCMSMFCLLLMSKQNLNWAIRIPAEISIGLCLSALGWIFLVLLFYRNLLLMPLRTWIKNISICLAILIPSLYIFYPTKALEYTALRIICPQTDPSANARLLAFIPINFTDVGHKICPSSIQTPSEAEINNEATTAHQRGSNITFIKTAFGFFGIIAFSGYLLFLVAKSRSILSTPIFSVAVIMSSVTEPVFWLGFIGCALLIEQKQNRLVTMNEAFA